MSAIILQASLFHKAGVGTDSECEDLLRQLNDIRDAPATELTNDGCWRSTHQYESIDWLTNEIINLFRESVNFYSSVDSVFAKLLRNEIKINYWTNINQPGSRNVVHSHKPGICSGVYYIQGTNTGRLKFINPANLLSDCNPRSPFTRAFQVSPLDRDLVMFPSWMPHEVDQNLSDRERISIAYDVAFV